MLGRGLALLCVFGATLLLLACEDQNTYVAPPAPKVTVARPLVQDVTDYLEYTGTIVAYARAEVPARVAGVLQNVHFVPGTPVNQGDLLFSIDPVEYEAKVQAAEAELARAEARRTETGKTLERSQKLIKKGNISQAKVDEAQAEFLAAKAEVLVREANLTRARINLGYTKVTAPITGRVGRNLVDVGNLVGQNQATALTDITTYDPIYVYFEVNERDLLRYMARDRSEANNSERAGKHAPIPLELGLADEEGFPHKGLTDYADSQVDPDTGTIRVRGVLENPGREPALIPGLFVRIRLPFQTRPNISLMTERAIGFDQSGQYVLVVNADNVVEKRNVTLGSITDGMRVIESGINADERVVVNGLQRAREGVEVEAEEIDMATLTASAIEEAIEAGEKAERKDKDAEPSDQLPMSGSPDAVSTSEAAKLGEDQAPDDPSAEASTDAAVPAPAKD